MLWPRRRRGHSTYGSRVNGSRQSFLLKAARILLVRNVRTAACATARAIDNASRPALNALLDTVVLVSGYVTSVTTASTSGYLRHHHAEQAVGHLGDYLQIDSPPPELLGLHYYPAHARRESSVS